MSNELPVSAWLRTCRSRASQPLIADSSGVDLSGTEVLAGALCFRRVLQQHGMGVSERCIGILLPPSAAAVLVNMAVALLGKVAVHLNYTLSDELLQNCLDQAGIRHVITSQKLLDRRPMSLTAQLVTVESLRERITAAMKFTAYIAARFAPLSLLARRLGIHRVKPDDLLTVIFTSGSTGTPKGVMLSHENIRSNVAALGERFDLRPDDAALGVLPFFHSAGFTVLLWLPAMLGVRCVYHFNPLDARTIGELVRKHRLTIVATTPTFLRSYLKRCGTEDFESVDLVVVGAEKLPVDLAQNFESKFGIAPTEGYGSTELSPMVAVNVPPSRVRDAARIGQKPGTVGRPLRDVQLKLVHPETAEEVDPDQPGRLLVRGPNVMLGYLNRPDETAKVLKDGWYDTGDIAVIDRDGFLAITGRLSRFSKIGGEMVPHGRIEDELSRILANGDADSELRVAVTAVPDAAKGERLVVLHTSTSLDVAAVRDLLAQAGLPPLWLPGADSFVEVSSIPVLGTGKLDLKAIREAAMQHVMD